jgi:signal transduction histidine kinase
LSRTCARTTPHADFAVDASDDLAIDVQQGLLYHVVENAADNAARHNDADEPSVTVTADHRRETAQPLRITVTDNGPGIPDHEIDVIQSGTETALEHGSGLGLWVLSWGLRHLGGVLSFDTTDGGASVRIDLPHQPRPPGQKTRETVRPAADGGE